MKVSIGFIDFSRKDFITNGPNFNYYFKDGYLVLNNNCFSNKQKNKITFNADKVFCVVEEN